MSTVMRTLEASTGIPYHQLIDQDAVPPSAHHPLRAVAPYADGPLGTPVRRYTTREYHELEMRHLWSSVWQMACREEEIPAVGDYILYEIGTRSIIVVRTREGIRAHHNVCLHRGRRLCDRDGHAASFICPFHGFSWNLDGSCRSVTSAWDFPHVEPAKFALGEVACDTWGGWVFVNPDRNCGPLLDHLDVVPDHFAMWHPEDRYIEAHVAKVMRCNWKLCQEAFMESFHVIATHPQILAGIGDENSQYDAWRTVSRAISANGTPSPHLRFAPDEQEIFDSVTMRHLDDPPLAHVPPGDRARSMLAAGARDALSTLVRDGTEISDADVSDAIYYTVFPNFHPWGGYNRINYRFRPHGDRHDESIMECYFLAPFAGERPPPARMHWLDADQPWTDAPELGLLAKVFQQDTLNLPRVQAGLESAPFDDVVFARYQETKIRHFHALLTERVGR